MKVPVATPDITPQDIAKVTECVASGWVSGISPYTTAFEKSFSEWNGNKYGIATGSGTTALHLGLAALKLPRGGEVIMPSFTMIATANACTYLGLKPVFIDCRQDTWCMDETLIEEAITEKTVAIMPVHIYGHMCDMIRIMEIAWEHDLKVIEDAAEAHGATQKHKKAGTFGDIGCFSFYANKIITTGEGGMIVTDDVEVAERANWLRAHAFGRQGKHYWHEEVGYGYRMSGMQAALGLSQLRRIDEYIQKRQMTAWYYMNRLIELAKDETIVYPVQLENYRNVYWMFSLLMNPLKRRSVMEHLEKADIETRTFFYPLHDQPPYKQELSLPVSEQIAAMGINLPTGNQLTIQQIDYVCDKLIEALK